MEFWLFKFKTSVWYEHAYAVELGLGQWAYKLLDDFDFERLKMDKVTG